MQVYNKYNVIFYNIMVDDWCITYQAASVASACSVMGIGSDIGGSIRMPAFFNGVFGHKPSPFLVPNKGQ